MIELKNVSLAFGSRSVLKDCSLSLAQGEHCAVMGPSGCGKTTLLRLILGLQQPDSGSVSVSGRIACVFQVPRLLPWGSALENVNVVLSDRAETLPDARRRLAEVGLADAEALLPASMSGGMQQRLAVARALAYGGDILLLDEPFKGCDGDLRERLFGLVEREASGKTLLLITHDEQEARRLADRIGLLENGAVHIM